MTTERDKAEHDYRVSRDRLKFAKVLVRTEPCERSRSYKRKVRRHGARARRRIDQAVVREDLEAML